MPDVRLNHANFCAALAQSTRPVGDLQERTFRPGPVGRCHGHAAVVGSDRIALLLARTGLRPFGVGCQAMRRAFALHRHSRWRHLVWLPAIVLLTLVVGLMAPVHLTRILPQQISPALRGSMELDGWTVSAVATSRQSALAVDLQFISKDEDNMSPPPWPVVSAVMRDHRMTERFQTRALGPTHFVATLESPMRGAWTIQVEADGASLQFPFKVR